MAILRQIANQFDPVYLRPTTLAKAVQELVPKVNTQQTEIGNQLPRYPQDRRSGQDRRRKNQPVLIDMRSPHSRRVNRGRRDAEPYNNAIVGIDTYA